MEKKRSSIGFMVARAVLIAICVLNVCPASAKDNEPLHTARFYVDRARNYEESNSWEAAKREVDEGLEHYPNDPDLRYHNGRYYYYAQKDLNQARYNLVRSIQSNDQHYHAKRLLVDVEDESKHYSSAICYINELLEFQPYEKTLWRRKIALYRKIGHKTEADEALDRLARIYPNDSIVMRDLSNKNRENWTTRQQRTSLTDRANELEKWLETDKYVDYYTDLVDTYYKLGEYDRAIGAANRGLAQNPNNQTLVRMAVNIMTEMGLYTRALTFMREHRTTGAMYNSVLRDAANDARIKDPYEANGRYYELTKDNEALAYLLNTSITRGYYDDAHYYLNESYKRHGRTDKLLAKEYMLEKRFGNEKQQFRILEELYLLNPQDDEFTDEYANMILELARRDIQNEQWPDASERLAKAIGIMTPEHDAWAATISQQITMMGRQGKFADARNLFNYASSISPDNKIRFASAYEDIAANRLKALIDMEEYVKAMNEAEELLSVVPNSEAALRCCINMSQTLKQDDLFHKYADLGYVAYPESPYFIVKRAVSLQQRNRNEDALAILRPKKDANGLVNPQLTAAYSSISLEWANLLIKEKMPDLALEKLDTALLYDSQNTEILYTKGVAHELLKQYDLAYYYQNKYYNPSNAEQEEWYQHMRYLRFRGYKNRVDATYTTAHYDTKSEDLASVGHLYSIASVAYSRLEKDNTYTGQVSYKGIDGYHNENGNESGGVGLELMGQWEHVFNDKWTGMVNASYSTKYFNKFGFNVSASYAAPNDWTPSLRLGFRRTSPTYLYLGSTDVPEYKSYNLFLFTPSIEKSFDRIKTSLTVDLSWLNKSIYYNVGWKGKLFINEDNISSVGLMAGFGSFPELTFFDQTALQGLSHTNAMVGIEAQYLLTKNMYLGLSGNWNTYYNPYRNAEGKTFSSYRNIYSLSLQLHVAF